MQPIQNAYGTLYLTQNRANEFMNIISNHHRALLLELKEHNLIPSHISLEKTTVWEYEDIIKQGQSKQ